MGFSYDSIRQAAWGAWPREQHEEIKHELQVLRPLDLAGKPLTLEFGKYCEQAAGSVWVHLGDTVVMVNATMSPEPRPGVDFFPLAVDVEEKQYSVGKIPGGFIKREGRPTEKATLTCRLIDRPAAPPVPQGHAQRRAGGGHHPVRGQGQFPRKSPP